MLVSGRCRARLSKEGDTLSPPHLCHWGCRTAQPDSQARTSLPYIYHVWRVLPLALGRMAALLWGAAEGTAPKAMCQKSLTCLVVLLVKDRSPVPAQAFQQLAIRLD